MRPIFCFHDSSWGQEASVLWVVVTIGVGLTVSGLGRILALVEFSRLWQGFEHLLLKYRVVIAWQDCWNLT
jgi:hypothetical protein